MTGIPLSTLSRIESGETEKFDKYRDILAKALKCSPEDIDGDTDSLPTVPVVGHIKYKTFVKDADPKKYAEVERLSGLPETAQAVEIITTDLVGYHGIYDLLYFDSIPQENERLFLDKECIVHLDTKKRGERLLAWVTKGSKSKHYHLYIHGAAIMTDVKIHAAFPVLNIKRG